MGDVGGTHARMAVASAETGVFEAPPRVLSCSAYDSLEALVASYLAQEGASQPPTEVAVAVAGPVQQGSARFTNLPWRVSEAGLRGAGFARAVLINDFEALALALPRLTAADLAPVGSVSRPTSPGTAAVLGPGTGFGAAALCQDARGAAVLVTEGGHIGFAPTDEVEVQVWRILTRRFGRVSIERILSGPGLVNLYLALSEIAGRPVARLGPAEILVGASEGDAMALAAVERFCSILGAVAGDFALGYGAVGGVFLAGGIAPRLLTILNAGGFRSAFERKGRFADVLAAIPTQVVTHPFLALLGALESLGRTP